MPCPKCPGRLWGEHELVTQSVTGTVSERARLNIGNVLLGTFALIYACVHVWMLACMHARLYADVRT